MRRLLRPWPMPAREAEEGGARHVVARTVAGGRAEGLASCVGTGLGGLVHVLAASLGLSLPIAQSAAAFALVKYLGAAYLAYLGIRLLLRRSEASAVRTSDYSCVSGCTRR